MTEQGSRAPWRPPQPAAVSRCGPASPALSCLSIHCLVASRKDPLRPQCCPGDCDRPFTEVPPPPLCGDAVWSCLCLWFLFFLLLSVNRLQLLLFSFHPLSSLTSPSPVLIFSLTFVLPFQPLWWALREVLFSWRAFVRSSQTPSLPFLVFPPPRMESPFFKSLRANFACDFWHPAFSPYAFLPYCFTKLCWFFIHGSSHDDLFPVLWSLPLCTSRLALPETFSRAWLC